MSLVWIFRIVWLSGTDVARVPRSLQEGRPEAVRVAQVASISRVAPCDSGLVVLFSLFGGLHYRGDPLAYLAGWLPHGPCFGGG
jgi:hypothetical protein